MGAVQFLSRIDFFVGSVGQIQSSLGRRIARSVGTQSRDISITNIYARSVRGKSQPLIWRGPLFATEESWASRFDMSNTVELHG